MSTAKRSAHEKKDGERAGVVDLTGLLLKSYMVSPFSGNTVIYVPLVGQLMWIFYPMDNVSNFVSSRC